MSSLPAERRDYQNCSIATQLNASKRQGGSGITRTFADLAVKPYTTGLVPELALDNPANYWDTLIKRFKSPSIGAGSRVSLCREFCFNHAEFVGWLCNSGLAIEDVARFVQVGSDRLIETIASETTTPSEAIYLTSLLRQNEGIEMSNDLFVSFIRDPSD